MFYLIFRCEEPVPRAERWCDPLCIKSSCWVGRGEGGVVQPVGTGARGPSPQVKTLWWLLWRLNLERCHNAELCFTAHCRFPAIC